MRVLSLTIIITWTLFSHGLSQQKVKFEQVTREEGLANTSVKQVIQDSDGFIWMATEGGMYRADGYSVKAYRHQPGDTTSLSGNSIYYILEDRTGTLWVAANGGLNRLDKSTDRFVQYRGTPDAPDLLLKNAISAMAEDEEGFLWIAVEDQGLIRFDPRNHEFSIVHELSEYKDITSMYRSPSGSFWAGTTHGLITFHPQQKKVSTYFNTLRSGDRLPDKHVLSVRGDGRGNILIGTRQGASFGKVSGDSLIDLDNYTGDTSPALTGESVYDVLLDKSGKLWIATDNGLNSVDPSTWRTEAFFHDDADATTIADNVCYGILEDRQGIVWIATKGGLSKYDAGKLPFTLHDRSTGFPASTITAIRTDRYGSVWIGAGNTLIRRDHRSGNYQNISTFSGRNYGKITAIAEDVDGWLWIGTEEKTLLRFNKNSVIEVLNDPLLEEGILSLAVENGILWVGTTTGLFKKAKDDRALVKSIPMINEPVQSIFKDRTEELWIGTDRRLIRMVNVGEGEPSIKTYTHIVGDVSSLSHNDVTCLFEAKDGKVWIGTNGGGLNYFNKATESFTAYTWDDGLPSDNIRGIEGDSRGNLWVTTDKGICRFDPLRRLFTNYDKKDGLQGNVFYPRAIARNKQGEIFFGGTNGMNTINADSVATGLVAPKILINEFQIRYKPVRPGGSKLSRHISQTEQIELNHDDNVITFGFVSVNHRDPDKDRYAFKLVNFEDDWNYRTAAHREATYTNLPPGNYMFMVKCMNTDGIWSQEATIKILVAAPFYKRWWFYSACIALVGFALYAYHVKKSNEVEYVRSVMEQQIMRRTNELRKEKERVETLSRELESLQKQNGVTRK